MQLMKHYQPPYPILGVTGLTYFILEILVESKGESVVLSTIFIGYHI